MIIKSYRREYVVHFTIDFDFMDELSKKDNVYVIIDRNISDLYHFDSKFENYFVMNAIEENKTLDYATQIIEDIVSKGFKKNMNLLAIGGGIVQDTACYISSVLYRGINWTLVPTTLLSQTDSCIGSKSSINFKNYKNLIGTFYPPSEIYICTRFVDTLTERDYKSGLGEMLKIRIMSSKVDVRSFISNLDLLMKRDHDTILYEIKKNLEFKKRLIEEDEFDTGIRNTLNFGHTFGHAIEATTGYLIPHGQAVSIGILIANELSYEMGLISEDYKDSLKDPLYRIIDDEFKTPELYDEDALVSTMKMDKKYTGVHNCILTLDEGVRRVGGISSESIYDAIRSFKSGFVV